MPTYQRVWLSLSLISVLVIVSFHEAAGRQGLLWGVIIALSINFFFFFYNEIRIDSFFNARQIEGRDPWKILETVTKFSKAARVPIPKIFIIDNQSPQAAVTGKSWKSSRIYLTEGLIENLTSTELEAVLAYQVACIKKLDTLAFTIASALASVIFFITSIGDGILRGILGSKKESMSNQNHLLSLSTAGGLSLLLHIILGKKVFFESDQLALNWLENPQYLAKALWKLDSYASTNPLTIPPSLAPIFIVNPLTKYGWTRYFSIHPNVDKRIKKIVGHYPI